MNKIFLIMLASCGFIATQADALKVSVFPSFTFRSSNHASYPVQRVVHEAPYMELRSYIDPYTGCEYFYEVPVYRTRVVTYPQRCHSHATDFSLGFSIR